jgi:hypothetical protein
VFERTKETGYGKGEIEEKKEIKRVKENSQEYKKEIMEERKK